MLDKGPPVTAGPENQYVAVGHHCVFHSIPVDHMENRFILQLLATPVRLQSGVH